MEAQKNSRKTNRKSKLSQTEAAGAASLVLGNLEGPNDVRFLFATVRPVRRPVSKWSE